MLLGPHRELRVGGIAESQDGEAAMPAVLFLYGRRIRARAGPRAGTRGWTRVGASSGPGDSGFADLLEGHRLVAVGFGLFGLSSSGNGRGSSRVWGCSCSCSCSCSCTCSCS